MAKGLSLGTKVFLITALLLAASMGAAVVVTSQFGSRVADDAVRDALEISRTALQQAQQQRYEQLRLVGQLFQTDAALQSYVAETAEAADAASVLDLLGERQASLGYDFAILLDSRGRVVARTDKPTSSGEDLSAHPLIRKVIDEQEANGVWQEGDQLYFSVAVPVIKAFVLQGYLVTGFIIDNSLALDLKKSTGADVAYLARTSSGPRVIVSTLNSTDASALIDSLRKQDLLARTLDRGQATERAQVEIGDRNLVALISPLRDAAGQPVGATVSLANADRAAAGYRSIQQVLALVGLASVLLAGALSYLLSRRAMAPVRKLVAATDAARQGNYDQRLAISGGGEVGQLAHSFDVLLSTLREKRDMEAYVADLSRNLPEAGSPGAAPSRPAQTKRVALLAFELRGYSQRRMTTDATGTIERLARDVRRISNAVAGRRGRVESVLGHRVLASFEGPTATLSAFTAAADIHRALLTRENAFDETETGAAAISVGDAVTGSVAWGQGSGSAVAGPPVQMLEGLLREAAVGDVLMTREAHEDLREPVFEPSGFVSAPQRALVGGLQFHTLSGETAGELATAAGAANLGTLDGDGQGGQNTLAGVAAGTLLGQRFEIQSVLGAGGMGVVYRARDRELDDLVALKMLKRSVADDTDLLVRLKSELKLARKITHPNVLRTFDFGEIDGLHYISMEYVRGITLRYLLDQEGRLPYSAGLRLAKQLCAGLGAAHDAGVLHRDIKPENLILDHAGGAKLMDFGIARPTRRGGETGQTQAGWVVGTPQYLAPEQIEGREVDERADIYATGVVLFEIFTGQAPFKAENPMQVMLQHLHETPPPPRNLWPDIPKDLEAIILKALEKDREKRFRKVSDVSKALDKLS